MNHGHRLALLRAVIVAGLPLALVIPGAVGMQWQVGGLYHAKSVEVASPNCQTVPAPQGLVTNATVDDVRVSVWVSRWCAPGGGALSGVAVEPDGTLHHFSIGGPPVEGGAYRWFSANGRFGVEWCETSGVTLYSRA